MPSAGPVRFCVNNIICRKDWMADNVEKYKKTIPSSDNLVL